MQSKTDCMRIVFSAVLAVLFDLRDMVRTEYGALFPAGTCRSLRGQSPHDLGA